MSKSPFWKWSREGRETYLEVETSTHRGTWTVMRHGKIWRIFFRNPNLDTGSVIIGWDRTQRGAKRRAEIAAQALGHIV